MKVIFLLIAFSPVFICNGQFPAGSTPAGKELKFGFGINAGCGWAYEDESHLLNTMLSVSVNFKIRTSYYIQFAPQYSWLWKWNEHYLTLPLQLGKNFGKRISLFAGPAVSFDIGYFKDFGASVGAYFQISEKSALSISSFSFSLCDYRIDYLYVPVSISYRYSL